MPPKQQLQQQLQHQLKTHLATRYIIGYSGGRDSHVLLHCLYQLRQAGQLTTPMVAIHVNHRLQKSSKHWAKHCQGVCEDYGIELITETVTENPKVGESIEAFAREARYALIKKHLKDADVFLSAHHQRDQAETFLLQLMRGAGLDGLQAMPVMKLFGAGQYLRPLLNVGYDEIVAYAEANQLNFITDDSNNDTRFNRNYIRHEVLPVLKQRFPQAEQSIARSATWLGEVPTPNVPDKLYLPTLRDFSLHEQKQQIRDYCKAKTGQALSKTQTDYILNHHLTAGADKQPQLNVGNYVIRRYNDELMVTAVLPHVGELWVEETAPRLIRNNSLPCGGGLGRGHPQAENQAKWLDSDTVCPPPNLPPQGEGITTSRHVSDGVCLPLSKRGIYPATQSGCWIEGDLQPKDVDFTGDFVNPTACKSPLTPLCERGGLEISKVAECTVGTDDILFLPHVENDLDKIEFAKLTWQTGQGGLPPKTYQLKPLDSSMRFHPHTRSHSTTVKKLLHEAGIAPWLRPFWLGLFDGEALVAIPNVGVAKKTFQKNTNAVIPLWQIEQKFVKL